MTYYTITGDIVTREDIAGSVANGSARLVHTHAEGYTSTGLALCGLDIDTRGGCHSIWDEVWTTRPKSIAQACIYAK